VRRKFLRRKSRRFKLPKQDTWNWLDGDKSVWDGSNSAHQPEIERHLLALIHDATKDELDKIGDKLAKLKSNFVVCMLSRHSDVSPRHRLNAFRSLAKRRKQEIPRYLRDSMRTTKLKMTYAELSMLGPIKLMKTILTFYRSDQVLWKMSDQELDKLLFPASMKMPDEVVKVKKRVKRLIHGIGKNKMTEMLVNHTFEELDGSEEKIKKLIRDGFYGFTNSGVEQLEEKCYKLRLLTL